MANADDTWRSAGCRAVDGWKLEDAKARFSEVVRLARADGPQRVTVRGRDAVVVLSAEDYERLVAQPPEKNLVDFLSGLDFSGLDLSGIDLDRGVDRGRDVEL